MPEPKPVRVRIAPSPTGALHLGLCRTALFNWAFARRSGGTFLLRIEDTDRERSTKVSERAILEGLHWLGVAWDEGPDVGGPFGPYYQSERIALHLAAADQLLATGAAYRCFCTHERLEALREEQAQAKQTSAYDRRCASIPPGESAARAASESFTIRFRVPPGTTSVDDAIRGLVSFENREVDDWIMVRGDGNPTYNFVVVCDDIAMRITHVLRGEEHLVNTPKQVLLYQAFGVEPPRFGHLPLMLGKDKKKLSKRSGDVSLDDYRAKGYPKEAIVNFLCLQGWALDGATEVFSVEQFVQRFDVGDVSKGGAIFDPDKFLWLAGEYIRAEPVEQTAERALPFVVAAGVATQAELEGRADWYHRAVASHRERIRLYSELPAWIDYLFAPDDAVVYDEAAEQGARKHATRLEVLADYRAWLEPQLARGVDADSLREATRAWVGERGLKFPVLFQPLRCALTGKSGGPDLSEVMALLGAEASLARLSHGIARLR